MDKDSSGFIDIEELREGFESFGIFKEGSKDEIIQVFNSMDIDKNGSITYNEFLAGTIADIDESVLHKAFMYID